MVKRSNSRAIQKKNRQILAASPACHICGGPIDLALKNPDPMAGVVDHVVPIARGGLDIPSNKKSAHRSCNRDKSDKEFGRVIRRSGSLNR